MPSIFLGFSATTTHNPRNINYLPSQYSRHDPHDLPEFSGTHSDHLEPALPCHLRHGRIPHVPDPPRGTRIVHPLHSNTGISPPPGTLRQLFLLWKGLRLWKGEDEFIVLQEGGPAEIRPRKNHLEGHNPRFPGHHRSVDRGCCIADNGF